MTNTSHDKAFRSSLDMLLEEERFAKANALSPWENLLAELHEMFVKAGVYGPQDREVLRATSIATRRPNRSDRELFAKAMRKPPPKSARIVSIKVHDPSAEAGAVVTKSFQALRNDPNLSAAQRGELMLGLSSLATKAFGQSGQISDRLDQVRGAIAMLERAKAQHHIDQIDPLVEQIKQAVSRGETEPSDLLVLESRLHEVRRRLEEHTGHGKE